MSSLEFQDWGLIDYQQALTQQLELVEYLHQNPQHSGFVIFCSHPPVVTTGRQTQPDDIFSFKGPIIEVSRGGRATYHGPSQLVIYPIINLKNPRAQRGAQEVRGYLRDFEKAIVLTLNELGIAAVGKTTQKLDGAEAESEETGVWIGSQKIASLGIAIKKWITYHGAALNVEYDSQAFQGLNPCGFKSSTMTCIETQLNNQVDRTQLKKILTQQLQSLL